MSISATFSFILENSPVYLLSTDIQNAVINSMVSILSVTTFMDKASVYMRISAVSEGIRHTDDVASYEAPSMLPRIFSDRIPKFREISCITVHDIV